MMAWLRSELNQREYCEAYGIPLKAFGNWRARFKAEPPPPARKVLYRRGCALISTDDEWLIGRKFIGNQSRWSVPNQNKVLQVPVQTLRLDG
jgi:hypothetical protein